MITVILKGPGDAEKKPKTGMHPESLNSLCLFPYLLMGNNKRIVGWMYIRFLAVVLAHSKCKFKHFRRAEAKPK